MVYSLLVLGASAAEQRSEPWQKAYAGADANGTNVVAYWRFEAGEETKDSSGHGHELKLSGATATKDGRFGGGLLTSDTRPEKEKRHAALTPSKPDLSPKGAFTVEMWLKPAKGFSAMHGSKHEDKCYLLDKKYASETDYQFLLPGGKSGTRHLEVNLGFGESSESYHSDPVTLAEGKWAHVAFAYNGEGEVRFFLNGANAGVMSKPGRGAIAPGKGQVSIGDRAGSYYGAFFGTIDEVRICNGALDFNPIRFALKADRTAFRRMEKPEPAMIEVRNLQGTPLKGAKVVLAMEGTEDTTKALPEIAPGATHQLTYEVNTKLRPGEYTLKARIEVPGEMPFQSEDKFSFHVAARPLPYRMPVLMWGIYSASSVTKEMGRLKDLGFTHVLGLGADNSAIWQEGAEAKPSKEEKMEDTKRMLDAALVNDLSIVASLSPGHYMASDKKEVQRVNRQGKPTEKPDVCGLYPQAIAFCENVGKNVARNYGKFPALQGALINTEARDKAQLCFHEHDLAAYKKFSGQDIPAEAMSKSGVHYSKLKDFPANRVVPDDFPLLKYYRWFWTQGDGWNEMHSAVNRGLKTMNRPDFWTFHDPAVRCASIAGSGGSVDYLSQWTYSYPDPIRIALPTDELFAMAKLAPQKQGVMKMTQIIWYRSQTAPSNTNAAGGGPVSVWEDHEPNAAFITIAPVHLREAFWTKIARPIQGIMYHGWQSLVATESTSSYRFTHPDTQKVLQRLVREVVEPLGPTLMQVPERKADVGYLESFTSQMFSQRGSYGWAKGWSGDAYEVLHYAQLQPEVLQEDSILRGGLGGLRVLVMMDCEVLPQGLVQKIAAFQKQGGLIVGDENLCPGIKADIVVPSYSRVGKADVDKAALLERAAALRQKLDAKYAHFLESSNPNLVTHARQSGAADYVFVVNDRREFGDYVGMYGKVMENGLPSEGQLKLSRSAGFVYDLVDHRELKPSANAGKLSLPVNLGPGEGRVFLVTDQPIAKVDVTAPAEAKLGQTLKCQLVVGDASGKPLSALVPVKVEILDPAGRLAEFSGYYGAKDGALSLNLDLAANDRPGTWEIRVHELASNKSGSGFFKVGK